MLATVVLIIQINALVIICGAVMFLQLPNGIKVRHLQIARRRPTDVMS